MTHSQVQIEDTLREVGYRQWADFPDLWMHEGEGVYLTEEALFREWKNALARAGRAEQRHAECFDSLVTMAIGSSALFVWILFLLWLRSNA